MTTSLNAATLPLRGRHLIEASAGTGKTFTVANLYLRLLIDAQLATPPTVENILVVTFTIAATEELRGRLRSRIAVALQVLDGDSPDDADATLHAVLEPHRSEPATRTRLELAYQCMDQAAIFTIHGFCDRVLREQAFESGELFDAELQADVETLKLRAAQAWWRTHVTPMSTDEIEMIPHHWRTPAAVLNRLSSVITDPATQLVPQFSAEDIQRVQNDYQSAWQVFRAAWTAEGESWTAQILAGVQSKLINKSNGKYTAETVAHAAQLARSLVQQEDMPAHIENHLSVFGNIALSASTRKGRESETPQSELGDCIDSLLTTSNLMKLQQLVELQNNAKAVISRDLAQRKLIARQRTFDDLLLQLRTVLYGQNGDRLTEVLRARYPVGLIDEFQDTDRIQYEIFNKLFPVDPKRPTALYLIGDPKQSIYRFRGAEISMYMRARNSADDQHPLDENWRSSAGLLNALNALYTQSAHPFGSAAIQYQPVTAGGSAEGKALTLKGKVLAPLQFDCIDVTDEKLPNVDQSEQVLALNCAQRVAMILAEGNARLGNTPVEAKDIAVLVPTHLHAQAIRNALLKVGVASAMQSRESVFQSSESLDILALLRVLARPGDSTSLSRVLVSPLGGYSAQELLKQRNDASGWQHIEESVQRCREQCRQAGPQAAVLRFMSLFNSRVRASGTVAGQSRGIDRILGNYLHLADLLQAAWYEQPDILALLKTAQRWRELGADEAMQLRLESDESLVQIMTVHKCKGLQFPVVMLPFACMGKDPAVKGDAVTVTDKGLTLLDVGSDQLVERQAQITQAQQDESMRALYVALTRAEQSCWIGVIANKNARFAALWQLLGVPRPASTGKTDDCQLPVNTALDQLISTCPDIAKSEVLTVQNVLPAKQSTDAAQRARIAKRYVQSSWRVGSYTGLARGATHAIEQPDHDAADVQTTRPETIDHNSPYHFPRGAEAGTLIHAVFEHLDFRSTSQQQLQDYAEKQLRAHGVDTQWIPALCQLVRNTLDTPLEMSGLSGGFSLSALDTKDRLDELGFHFPVQSLQAEQLVNLLREAEVLGAEDGLLFDRLDGYMTGFIDLTFRHDNRWYIADYKSNHLGYEPEDYNQNVLTEAMKHHRYDLQYLIYAVALRRYLSNRLPDFNSERDFGGVFYLFVRGMPGQTDPKKTDPKKTENYNPTGVYVARPPEKLLDALDQLLNGDRLSGKSNGNA